MAYFTPLSYSHFWHNFFGGSREWGRDLFGLYILKEL